MNAVLDREFLTGFIVGVGIALGMKLLKDTVSWAINRKEKANLTIEMKKIVFKRIVTILITLRILKSKSNKEVCDLGYMSTKPGMNFN